MRRGLKITGMAFIVLLVVIQFFHPEKNSAPVDPEVDMVAVAQPPDQIAKILIDACYDCHSNQTHYPPYDRIQPVSWYLNSHIKKGKADLNFSVYGSMDKADRIGLLVKTGEVLEAGTMPLQSYLLFHKEARLSQEENALVYRWTEEEALKVMRE